MRMYLDFSTECGQNPSVRCEKCGGVNCLVYRNNQFICRDSDGCINRQHWDDEMGSMIEFDKKHLKRVSDRGMATRFRLTPHR
jgi:hypothetical protein